MIIEDKRQLLLMKVVLVAHLFLVLMCLKYHTFVKIKIIIKTMIIKIAITNNLLIIFHLLVRNTNKMSVANVSQILLHFVMGVVKTYCLSVP